MTTTWVRLSTPLLLVFIIALSQGVSCLSPYTFSFSTFICLTGYSLAVGEFSGDDNEGGCRNSSTS